MTWREGCELVVEMIRHYNPDSTVTADDVFNMSPTGELYPVAHLINKAILWDEARKAGIDDYAADRLDP